MKYLFFFNGQLLLLCCVCCKIAIQDFVKGIHKKIRNIYGSVPLSPTESPTGYNSSAFHRELKKIYGIVPQSPAALPTYITDGLRTSRSTHMSDACPSAQVPTDFLTNRKSLAGFSNFFGAHIN
jgi:hypothetical protein